VSSLSDDQHLKLYALSRGITISRGAQREWLDRYGGPMTLAEYASTSGVCLRTAEGIYINAPYLEEFTTGTEAHLDFDEEFVLSLGSISRPVEVLPVPAYHNTTYVDGDIAYPYTNLGVTHTDRCRISPIEGCAWRCTFCDLPYEQRYRMKPKEELLEVVRIAVKDELTPARHVLVSGGTPRRRDEPWIDEIYAYIAQNSPVPVDVMMPARDDLGYPAWLKDVGVNMLSVNLEISNEERARLITPNKARLGRDHYLRYTEAAVKAFGIGFVQSLMVFGSAIEPVSETIRGVQDLVDRGCIPVLSPFRPESNTPLGTAPPATYDEMLQVYEATVDICRRSGTGLMPGPRCIPCHHNTVAFPDDSGFYVPLDGDLRAPLASAPLEVTSLKR
jgi:hypothetical protein